MTSKQSALEKITAYIAENKLKEALEAEVKYMAVEANQENSNKQCPQEDVAEDHVTNQMGGWQHQKLDAIYDDEPLGFEKDPVSTNEKMVAQDPLEEINLGVGAEHRPTYISAKMDPQFKVEIVQLLKEFKDCFAWDYDEMPGLKRD